MLILTKLDRVHIRFNYSQFCAGDGQEEREGKGGPFD